MGVRSSKSGDLKSEYLNKYLKNAMGYHKDLLAFEKGYELAMEIFIL